MADIFYLLNTKEVRGINSHIIHRSKLWAAHVFTYVLHQRSRLSNYVKAIRTDVN